MPAPSTTTYSPVVDPRDLVSIPRGLGPNDELHVPLAPRRGRGLRAPSWIGRLRDAHRLILGFCYSDRRLLRWDDEPGRAEAWVARLQPSGALTMDVPWYAFMSRVQRERALVRSVAAISRALRAWEPRGIEVIPLVKGIRPEDWEPQICFAAEAGLARVAFYSREFLLERDEAVLRSFLRSVRRHGRRALLLGVFGPRPPAEGAFDAAASYHYVLARRRRILNRAGRPVRLQTGTYSDLLRRFVEPRDAAALTHHNFLRARELLARPSDLSAFGFQLT